MNGWARQFWLKNLLSLFPYWFESPKGTKIDCRRRYEIKMCEAFFMAEHYPMEFVRQPVRTVFDIGANMGLFTLSCLEQFGADLRQVVAVEPSAKTFVRLQRNIARNPPRGQTKVALLHEAVDATPGKATLTLGKAHYSHSLVFEKVHTVRGSEQVDVTTLDALKERYRVDALDILKIDVEGAELQVLQGAKSLLGVTSTIFIEAHKRFCTRADLVRVLTPYGFVLAPWDDSHARDHGDFCFVRQR